MYGISIAHTIRMNDNYNKKNKQPLILIPLINRLYVLCDSYYMKVFLRKKKYLSKMFYPIPISPPISILSHVLFFITKPSFGYLNSINSLAWNSHNLLELTQNSFYGEPAMNFFFFSFFFWRKKMFSLCWEMIFVWIKKIK